MRDEEKPEKHEDEDEDVREVPIGRPVSDEEYRRLKERARRPSEEDEEERAPADPSAEPDEGG